MTAHAVEPGRQLAGRYRVEDLLDEVGSVRSWRAVDEVLNRPVFVQTLPSDDERARDLVAAAQAAAQVGDTRFLQILDVASEDDTAYVVREWFDGYNLIDLLTGGPLTGDQASVLGRELAEALAVAHRAGLHHLRLEPAAVIVGSNGSVKIAGLATQVAVHGTARFNSGDPELVDAAGIGRILYAALTARWPGGTDAGLPVAPQIDGRPASPRQVRPGVPRLLDEIVDRTLDNADRHNAAPLRSPSEVAEALTTTASTRGNGVLGGNGNDPGPPPAVLNQPAIALLSNRAVPLAQTRRNEPAPARTLLRALGVAAGALFLIAAAMIGWQLLVASVGDQSAVSGSEEPPVEGGPSTTSRSSETTSSPTPSTGPIAISAANAYDPVGDGEENDSDASLTFDADESTAWRTVTYYDPLELQKDGVGVYFDLGAAQQISQINLTLVGDDSDIEVRVTPEGSGIPDDVDGWTVAAAAESVGGTTSVRLDESVTTRYVLVWFTRLPPEGGDFRGGIAEAEVVG